ncbi:hypothetical protein [Niabella drilacis]|uniref:Fasciclin domain-containing protein n=1 Tax=Niabella drilacis (strain DSM 25811 / CCM 8410 / CCUG 62505 / LMG 26954 / E90) TaxID=1285928 RepID=A0A1G7B3Z0_NIADE|nr:hypothetical protein [Niabella drilacis]SDE21809.1 hypothetical protein SAMN04487894_12711 [Niabella drilacis]
MKDLLYTFLRRKRAAWLLLLALGYAGCTKTDNRYRDDKPTAGKFAGTAYEYLQSQPGLYDSMLLAISRINGLSDTLKTRELTLFAVNNRSFSLAIGNINIARRDSVPQMPPVSIASMDPVVLDTFLCRYFVKDKHHSADLRHTTDGVFLPTMKYNFDMQLQLGYSDASGYVGGGPLSVIFSYPGSDSTKKIFTRYWTRVNTMVVDIEAKNAVINLLPPGHDFGFGSDFVRAMNRRDPIIQ